MRSLSSAKRTSGAPIARIRRASMSWRPPTKSRMALVSGSRRRPLMVKSRRRTSSWGMWCTRRDRDGGHRNSRCLNEKWRLLRELAFDHQDYAEAGANVYAGGKELLNAVGVGVGGYVVIGGDAVEDQIAHAAAYQIGLVARTCAELRRCSGPVRARSWVDYAPWWGGGQATARIGDGEILRCDQGDSLRIEDCNQGATTKALRRGVRRCPGSRRIGVSRSRNGRAACLWREIVFLAFRDGRRRVDRVGRRRGSAREFDADQTDGAATIPVAIEGSGSHRAGRGRGAWIRRKFSNGDGFESRVTDGDAYGSGVESGVAQALGGFLAEEAEHGVELGAITGIV